MSLRPVLDLEPIDTLLVLGQGYYTYGQLSATAIERRDLVSGLCNLLEPKSVIYTGSKKRDIDSLTNYANTEMNSIADYVGRVTLNSFLVESSSNYDPIALLPNLIKIKQIIQKQTDFKNNKLRIGVLGDSLDNKYGRVTFLINKFFPLAQVLFMEVNYRGSKEEELKEKLMADLTYEILNHLERPDNQKLEEFESSITILMQNNLSLVRY